MKDLTYKIIVKKISEDKYIASAPTLPNCYVESTSEPEVVEAIQEAIATAIKGLVARNEPVIDDEQAAVYNLTVEFAEKPSA